MNTELGGKRGSVVICQEERNVAIFFGMEASEKEEARFQSEESLPREGLRKRKLSTPIVNMKLAYQAWEGEGGENVSSRFPGNEIKMRGRERGGRGDLIRDSVWPRVFSKKSLASAPSPLLPSLAPRFPL